MTYNLPSRQFVKQDTQALVASPQVPRATFIAEKNRYTTFNAGLIYPIFWDEILPGDHMEYDITPFIRLATPLYPNYSRQRVDIHVFFVPNRLLWDNWQRFMGQQTDPAQSIDVEHPYRSPSAGLHGLLDHLGSPLTTFALKRNWLPVRAYGLIWNQWYRDQDLQAQVTVSRADGNDTTTNVNILPRNKFHDYFTAARPWPQKFTAPTLPVLGSAPVRGLGLDVADRTGTASGNTFIESGGLSDTYNFLRNLSTQAVYAKLSAATGAQPQIFADLSLATGISINQFRQAIMVQSLLERDARGGTRYIELLWNHFRVRNPDYRLQRAEYIGGGSAELAMTPVAQTAPGQSSVVGQLGAAATATGTAKASYAATEHGIIMGLISVRSELGYDKGLEKKWSRFSRYDYYWPSLHDLGEQAILNKEIYVQGTTADDEVFGYQERWSEYRYWGWSDTAGFMRTGVTGTLDAWHLIENFTALPTLGDTFIREAAGPVQRMIAAGGAAANQQYIGDIYMRRKATRPLGMFSVPASLGRF